MNVKAVYFDNKPRKVHRERSDQSSYTACGRDMRYGQYGHWERTDDPVTCQRCRAVRWGTKGTRREP